jgi:alpha,alpha-trehalose-phosphate synthase [UDP-forming]
MFKCSGAVTLRVGAAASRLPALPAVPSPVMNTFRLQLRFLVPLVLTLVAAAYLALPLMDRLTLRWFSRDLDLRGALLATTLSDSISDALTNHGGPHLQALLNRVVQDERLVAIGLCSLDGKLMHRTSGYPEALTCSAARQTAARADPLLRIAGGSVHVGMYPARDESGHIADVVLLHDMSFIERRSEDTREYLIILIAALGVTIAIITVVVAQLSWRGWVSGARALLRGEGLLRPLLPPTPELAPLAADLRKRLRELDDEYRRQLGPEAEWTPDHLRSLLRTQLRGDEIIVVSNREPYIHENAPAGVIVRRPASGLVTAIEPVMRACSGTWIAHGSGSADRQAVDAHDRVRAPPGREEYTLRRIWLTEQEERGYYYGFANEGMWPLCHVAHVRPVFRERDWLAYREVNGRFADAVVSEARSDDPVVMVQDYHFALLPAMIRERLPNATILSFWHIPWPNPESFGICPWRREILEGMLGSTILGFHTRYHCKNFIETVDRNLEARIEHEHSTISFHDVDTLVESYPISIEWPGAIETAAWPSVAECRRNVTLRLGLAANPAIAVGIDRLDYTKGVVERMQAVDRLLAQHPEWIGRFVLVQAAAPSRSVLQEYRSFQQQVRYVAERINQRYGSGDYRPIHLLMEHHEREAVTELYRAADVCLVTSLHDGMNVVCKEFVAARSDQRGVLILSRFAGAAREMTEALLVNPYHIEECAAAIQRALTMPEAEQRERMASLRMTVREFNVYRWAGRMLTDGGRLRLRQRIEARVQRHHVA